jgi:hypothetical protein
MTTPALGRRCDQVTHGSDCRPDPRELPREGLRTQDIYIPDLHITRSR